MPVSNPVVSQATLAAAVRANFAKTYDDSYKAPMAKISQVMEIGVPAKARTETFAYYETADYPVYWPYGETIAHGGFKSISYQVTCRRYGKRISWNEDDRKDDQTKSLMDRVRSLATHFGTIHDRAFFDLVFGTTALVPVGSAFTAPDGATLYATVAGGANRFGIVNGNLLPGTTGGGLPPTVASAVTDYYSGIGQFLGMRDTKGEPLHDPSLIEAGVLLLHASIFTEAFERAFLGQIVQGTAAGLSNIVINSGRKVELWGSPRFATNDFYLFLPKSPLKPTANIELEGLQTDDATRGNSDFARDRGEEYFQAYARHGWVVNVPYSTLMINNA